MTIAFPIWQDRISPLLDAATRLLVVTLRRGVEVQRREVLLGPLPPVAIARNVAELHVNVLLCAALSEQLLRELKKRRVLVRPHLCGELNAVLRAFCTGRLRNTVFHMPGCHPVCACQHRKRPARARNAETAGKLNHLPKCKK